MQVSVESTDGLERKLNIAVPAEQIDTEVAKRIVDASKKEQHQSLEFSKNVHLYQLLI